MKKLLSTKDVATLINVAPGTLAKAVNDRRIRKPDVIFGVSFIWSHGDVRRAARAFGKECPDLSMWAEL